MSTPVPSFVLSDIFSSLLRYFNSSLNMSSPQRKVLILAGPTAIGKSSTALSLCHQLSGEIISADSVQLYRHLNIASNKSPASHLNLVPHHLIDVADPATDVFTAGDYFRKARDAIHDIHSRNQLPVVVGGTMMYVKWLLYGRPATPPASSEAKGRVESMMNEVQGDWDKAIHLLSERDSIRANKLLKNDWYRLRRALEVWETVGKGVSDLPVVGAANKEGNDSDMDFDFRCVFLYGDRVEVNRTIDERCERMIFGNENGSVLEEVGSLLCSGGLKVAPQAPSRAIGYRQTIAYLVERALVSIGIEGIDKGRKEAFRDYLNQFMSATRGYAKQQMAWYRKDRRFRWVEAGTENTVEEIRSLVQMKENDYKSFTEKTQEIQEEIREAVKCRGKAMKGYQTKLTLLTEGSEAEENVVNMAEKWALHLAEEIPVQELHRMLEVIRG